MALKVKFRTQFPAIVTANSPVTLVKTGVAYQFGFDTTGLTPTLDAVYGKISGTLAQFSATTSAQLAGVMSDETGTGALVFATSPTLVSPALGAATASSLAITSTSANAFTVGPGGATNPSLQVDASVASAVTGLKVGAAAVGGGLNLLVVSTGTNEGLGINAKGSGVINIGSISTGIVTITPALSLGSTINKVTITAPATGSTLTIPDGVTLTGPAASGTAMTIGNAETITGVKTFGAAGNVGKLSVAGTTSGSTVVNASATASGTLTLPAATDTLVGKATTDILTNKTFDTAGSGNSLSVAGVNIATAWATYSPSVTSSSGTITTLGTVTGRSKTIGKTVFVEADVTITTAGTGAGLLQVTLPATAAAFSYIGSAREVAGAGKSGAAYIAASATTMVANDASATTFIANGARVIFSATYEVP